MDSKYIEQRLRKLKDKKSKTAFLESIMNNKDAKVLGEVNGHKTTMFQDCKGPKTKTWRQTKKMAFELNKAGFDVVFLSEPDGGICADSILKRSNNYRIADFKYCVTTKANTLSKELEHGFLQAGTVVTKLSKMDSGIFKDAIRYLLRNEVPYGDLILINRHGKVLSLTYKDIKSGKYVRKIKGFL